MKNPIYKKWWFWLIAVLVVFYAIGSQGDDAEKVATVSTDSTNANAVVEAAAKPEETAKPTEAPKKTEFEIGEVVKLGDNQLTVTKVEKSAGSDFDTPKEGHEYVIVHLTIQNTGNKNITYNPFDFSMVNSNGQIVDMGFTIVDTDTALSSGELAPEGKVSGTIAFEQLKDDPKLQLIYEPSFWSDKAIKVNLQ